ncbi:MAG: Hsp70 family protein [Myxococcales bacterium]|nr:Hsp70 family protein [Myxococcales bacterium]
MQRIAGLTVERILSEPTAAALVCGYAQYDNRHIAVVDLGGGTLDVTVMRVDQGKFEVLGIDGDSSLGGADFDRTLARHFAQDILQKHGLDVSTDPVAMQRLLGEAEVAKKGLTQRQTVDVSLPYLAQKDGHPINFDFQVSQDLYRTLVADLVERIAGPCQEALSIAGLRPSQLDDVILIGREREGDRAI